MKDELFSLEPHKDNSAHDARAYAPLAVRMRPRTLRECVGQEHILAPGKMLERALRADRLQSAIFYGPAGCGKTSLGMVIATMTRGHFETLNAVSSNSAEIRKKIEAARERRICSPHAKTILFIDEIHRFNTAQQDILMPEVEQGGIIVIGATTHNPGFAINGPLLSRSLVFELRPLSEEAVLMVLRRALEDTERGFGAQHIQCEPGALEHLARQAGGDARRALTALEIGISTAVHDDNKIIYFSKKDAEECVQKKIVRYDHDGDNHYDTISAFIKSMRGSDPQSSIYWLAKMIYAGEDPLFIARRMIIFASEDIGNADPFALTVAMNALHAVECVGMPEGRIALAQAVTYLATAVKSNASYLAIDAALADVKNGVPLEVPDHLRNIRIAAAEKNEGVETYQYPHEYQDHYVKQHYGANGKQYYKPTGLGHEAVIKQRMERLKERERTARTTSVVSPRKE